MTKIVVGSLFLALSFAVIANGHDELDGLTCLGKKIEIQQKIDDAKSENNPYKLEGLEKALKNIESYCTNRELEKKYLDKGEKQLANLKERQHELAEAKKTGKEDKIKKQNLKLKEAEMEFKSSQLKLAAFYNALKLEQKNN